MSETLLSMERVIYSFEFQWDLQFTSQKRMGDRAEWLLLCCHIYLLFAFFFKGKPEFIFSPFNMGFWKFIFNIVPNYVGKIHSRKWMDSLFMWHASTYVQLNSLFNCPKLPWFSVIFEFQCRVESPRRWFFKGTVELPTTPHLKS